MKLEELLPEIRKGRMVRRHNAVYLSDDGGCLCHIEDGAMAMLTGHELLKDDWELVPEPTKYKRILALNKNGEVFVCRDSTEWQFWKSHTGTVEMREIEWEVPK